MNKHPVTTEWIRELIAADELWRFYKTGQWMELKQSVLESDHYECQICKSHGIIKRTEPGKNGNMVLLSTVHHVQFVRNHPELALSKTYVYQGKVHRNLITICKACHNQIHDRNASKVKDNDAKPFSNQEMW